MKADTNQERLNKLFDADPRNDTSIADALGVSKQTLSAWRSGKRSPKKSMLVKISEVFHVSIEWLMGFDVPEEQGTANPAQAIADQPKNNEVRLLLQEMNKMTPEQIEQVKGIFKIIFNMKGKEEDDA